jgi:hypothetical protein
MNITQWAERVLQTIEQDGAMVERVQLVTTHDGEVYQSWHRPFPTADAFALDVDSMLRSLEQEFPARVVPMQLLAESRDLNGRREVLSRLPLRVTGRAKQGHLDSAQAATAVAFDSLAATIEKLQRLTNTQLDAARLHIEQLNASLGQHAELVKVYRERALETTTEPNPMHQFIAENGQQALQLLTQVAMHTIETKKRNK